MTLQYPVIIITTTNVVEHLYNGHFGTSQSWCILTLHFIIHLYIKQISTHCYITIHKYITTQLGSTNKVAMSNNVASINGLNIGVGAVPLFSWQNRKSLTQ